MPRRSKARELVTELFKGSDKQVERPVENDSHLQVATSCLICQSVAVSRTAIRLGRDPDPGCSAA
jgi:hypothetical protein